ncbi:hypothetical protein [uncultured Bacteroides sp.]|uniref:hypothetical protein n=1 Tax=uncultured Bacteroides sp. TaxID=162156 RepID=UPI00280BEDD7|nr:hypothetical protein [uncultured Bacteroides sp.]
MKIYISSLEIQISNLEINLKISTGHLSKQTEAASTPDFGTVTSGTMAGQHDAIAFAQEIKTGWHSFFIGAKTRGL